jgi:hypothetical protein
MWGDGIRVLFNASFGLNSHGNSIHASPIVKNDCVYYNNRLLSMKWPGQVGGFGIKYNMLAPQLQMIGDDKLSSFAKMDFAVGGMRKLRSGGMSVPLERGLGETTLKCSRTSMAWNADSGKLYILIVRAPNNESSNRHQAEQYGGWDVRQVQEYWEKLGLPNALLCNGGDTTQLVTCDMAGRQSFISSNRIGSKTLAY